MRQKIVEPVLPELPDFDAVPFPEENSLMDMKYDLPDPLYDNLLMGPILLIKIRSPPGSPKPNIRVPKAKSRNVDRMLRQKNKSQLGFQHQKLSLFAS